MVTLEAGVGKAFMVISVIVLLGESRSHKLSTLSGLEPRPGAVGWNVQLTAESQASWRPPTWPLPRHGRGLTRAQASSPDSILSSGFQIIVLSRPPGYNDVNFASVDPNRVPHPRP